MADKLEKMKPLQGMEAALMQKRKSMLSKIGGKPSPRFDMSGKRMTPPGLAGTPVPSSPSLPIPSAQSKQGGK
jgi:hypothetical protein